MLIILINDIEKPKGEHTTLSIPGDTDTPKVFDPNSFT
jgi:hypothetical protein